MNRSAMLTPKQEGFCLAYLETGNASEAYPSFGEAFQRSPREDFKNHFVGRSAA